ncbi:MAG: methylenetetrahydrofolate--tRNA-(uracil(54)-C(5))-methyltransferase (FADH(2)-oxidizing) TrmFO [Caldisericaceae bacterium]
MKVTIIGGGLAGSEAALQIAKRGVDVILYEMRPLTMTEAHKTGLCAELVCSNSLGSMSLEDGRGLLKEESLSLGSELLRIASETSIPAGKALAVDRVKFSLEVEKALQSNSHIKLVREKVDKIDWEGVVVVATGPLTTESLLRQISDEFGSDNLFFYDAISPIVLKESIDLGAVFYGGRYGQTNDYINAPMNESEYKVFYEELINANRHMPHDFDKQYFEACLPIEEIAYRGFDSMRYGPLTPRGFEGKYYAIVQLRRENIEDTMYELVGFQTALTYPEQKRVFSLIPGLSKAEFTRYGSIHKNTFIKSSQILLPTLQTRKRQNVLFAGQLSGVEGYVESITTGLFAGINASRLATGREPFEFPRGTMLGSLINFVVNNDLSRPQPMRANFGLMPKEFFDLPKRERKSAFIENSKEEIARLLNEYV